MKNKLKGIYKHIGPNKYDSKIVVRPGQIENMILGFGWEIAFWINAARRFSFDTILKNSFENRANATKSNLIDFLKWLGGDD